MKLTTFKNVGPKTNVDIPVSVLNSLSCGLFRATLKEAREFMPELNSLYDSIPLSIIDIGNYELDVKIHMLMANQWPCIPNWHCDNVPRGENGITDYKLAEQNVFNNVPKMLLWVSGTPCTQFLSRDVVIHSYPTSHSDVSRYIKELVSKEDLVDDKSILTHMDPQQWVEIDQLSPHRGMKSEKNQWRIFARLTHKSILPTRQQTTVLRKHSQVYLDVSEFSW